MQEEFLNSLVKVECDPIDVARSAKESNSSENNVTKVGLVSGKLFDIDKILWIAVEFDLVLQAENSESDNEQPADDAIDSNNEDSNELDGMESNAENGDESDSQNGSRLKKRAYSRNRRSKIIDIDYQKLFEENKHFLNMSCDCCSKAFESLEEARDHYLAEHGNSKGYIKTARGKKLLHRCNVLKYLTRRSNPMFKYVYDNNL